ncbi:MAG TPA: hypothetical protein VFI23_02475 [Rhizomicrobium sp.]|nr:hypothetical protein [Rhizomicrobium sp.]
MPQNGQAEGVASGPNWPWRRLMVGASAVLALVLCAAFANTVRDAFTPPPPDFNGFWDGPAPPPLTVYFIYAMLLFGAVAALWKGKTLALSVGWLAMLGGFLFDRWLIWRDYPDMSGAVRPWSIFTNPLFLFFIVGFVLALAGRSSRIALTNDDVK